MLGYFFLGPLCCYTKFPFFKSIYTPPKILLANGHKHIKKQAAFRIVTDLCKGVMTSLSTKACWKAAGSCSYKHWRISGAPRRQARWIGVPPSNLYFEKYKVEKKISEPKPHSIKHVAILSRGGTDSFLYFAKERKDAAESKMLAIPYYAVINHSAQRRVNLLCGYGIWNT